MALQRMRRIARWFASETSLALSRYLTDGLFSTSSVAASHNSFPIAFLMLSKLIIGAAVAASGAQMAAALPDWHGGINRDGGGHGGHSRDGGGHGGHGHDGGHGHGGGGGGGGGSGYNAPSSYNAPSPSYNSPSPSYNAPSPSYNEPSYDPPSYNSPSSGYDEPSSSYDSPSSSYGSPSTGYGYDDGGHGGGGLDLTSILIPLLALVGLSLLFPTYVSLTTVRRKREAGDEEWDPAGQC